MSEKMSTRGSGAKKGAPKYANKFAYVHNKGSKKTQAILALPVDGLCRRCTDQIQWRKQYRKYKPLTAAKKCVSCQLKKVKKAYHVLCDDCARAKKVCAKCQDDGKIIDDFNPKNSLEAQKDDQELERRLANMRERERRSYRRKIERGDIKPSDVPDLSDDDGDFDFTDSEDESNDEEKLA